MAHLLPHLVLRSRLGEPSSAAIALRSGGYALTKLGEDDHGVQLARAGHVDAFVIDLPPLHAIAFAKRVREEAGEIPILIISASRQAIASSINDVTVLPPPQVEDDIVSAVDRLLANHEMKQLRSLHA